MWCHRALSHSAPVFPACFGDCVITNFTLETVLLQLQIKGWQHAVSYQVSTSKRCIRCVKVATVCYESHSGGNYQHFWQWATGNVFLCRLIRRERGWDWHRFALKRERDGVKAFGISVSVHFSVAPSNFFCLIVTWCGGGNKCCCAYVWFSLGESVQYVEGEKDLLWHNFLKSVKFWLTIWVRASSNTHQLLMHIHTLFHFAVYFYYHFEVDMTSVKFLSIYCKKKNTNFPPQSLHKRSQYILNNLYTYWVIPCPYISIVGWLPFSVKLKQHVSLQC